MEERDDFYDDDVGATSGDDDVVELASADDRTARHELQEEARVSSQVSGTVSGDPDIQDALDDAPSDLMGMSLEDIRGEVRDGEPNLKRSSTGTVEHLPQASRDAEDDPENDETAARKQVETDSAAPQVDESRGEQGAGAAG